MDIRLNTARYTHIDHLVHSELVDEQLCGMSGIDLAYTAGHQNDLTALIAALIEVNLMEDSFLLNGHILLDLFDLHRHGADNSVTHTHSPFYQSVVYVQYTP